MFQETGSFYYCTDGDITNSIQRCHDTKHGNGCNTTGVTNDNKHKTPSSWKQAHDEFFWNKYMLQELIQSGVSVKDTLPTKECFTFN